MSDNNDDAIDALAKDCLLGKYILIVGGECILDPQKRKDVGGDSWMWMLKHLALRVGSNKVSFESNKAEETYQFLKERGLLTEELKSELEKQIALTTPVTENQNITIPTINELVQKYNLDHIRKGLNDLEYHDDDINPALIRLLETKCFRVVVTTAVDHHLERVMRNIWGDELQVLDIFSHADWGEGVRTQNEFCDVPPTLYYAFGKQDKNEQYVLTEDDAMMAIARWGNAMRPVKFGNYIKNANDKEKKFLLSMGCQLDNWQFRFFWYQLIGEKIKDQKGKGQVAMTWDENGRLKRYLDEIWGVITKDNTQEFIETLNTSIREQMCKSHPLGTYLFISYAHEDESRAYALAENLKARGLQVWIDKRLGSDGRDNQYDERIKAAIDNCAVFIPLMTNQTRRDLEKGELLRKGELDDEGNMIEQDCFRRYYFQEWQWFEESLTANSKMKRRQIVQPIVLNGYDKTADYHTKGIVQTSILKSSMFDTMTYTMDDLVKHINGMLNM